MSPTAKYLLVGGAVAGAVFIIAKAVSPAAPTTASSVASAIGSIGSTISSIWGSKTPPKTEAAADAVSGAGGTSIARTANDLASYNSDGSATAWSSVGDAAMVDGAGYSKLSGRNQQPADMMSKAQMAQVGNIPGSYYALKAS